MTEHFSYADHLDVLTAVVTHLALTPSKSRTVDGLVNDLGIPRERLQPVLDGFTGLIRRKDHDGKAFYTLHARFALRKPDQVDQRTDTNVLRADLLQSILEFAVGRARVEVEERRVSRQLAVTMVAAVIAAVAALASTVVSLLA